jgi:hypothetical protein
VPQFSYLPNVGNDFCPIVCFCCEDEMCDMHERNRYYLLNIYSAPGMHRHSLFLTSFDPHKKPLRQILSISILQMCEQVWWG